VSTDRVTQWRQAEMRDSREDHFVPISYDADDGLSSNHGKTIENPLEFLIINRK
jgi:hypothetical protein